MMNLNEYKSRMNEAAKNLVDRHHKGKKVTYTTAWNEVFFTVFNQSNFAKVDGVYHYMPETIAKVKELAITLL